MPIFQNAQFEISFAKPSALPRSDNVEIAFAGRSNAGKSSAINTLVGQTRLAFVSKTPGRTQLINFFRMNCGAILADLPGYGYSKVPEAVRRQWQVLLETYLSKRENLIGLVLVMDARHPLGLLDEQMIGWFAPSGRPIHVLLTKSDKLSRSQARSSLLQVHKRLQEIGDTISVQLFSSLKKQGMDEVETIVGAWLGLAPSTRQRGDIPPARV